VDGTAATATIARRQAAGAVAEIGLRTGRRGAALPADGMAGVNGTGVGTAIDVEPLSTS